MKNLKNKKGFTIVELVIVIAVIAILAAVLIPTFGNIINNAKESAAMQEARNAYTQYMAKLDVDTQLEDFSYVLADGKYFEVNNWDESSTTIANSTKYLDSADGQVKTSPAAAQDPAQNPDA